VVPEFGVLLQRGGRAEKDATLCVRCGPRNSAEEGRPAALVVWQTARHPNQLATASLFGQDSRRCSQHHNFPAIAAPITDCQTAKIHAGPSRRKKRLYYWPRRCPAAHVPLCACCPAAGPLHRWAAGLRCCSEASLLLACSYTTGLCGTAGLLCCCVAVLLCCWAAGLRGRWAAGLLGSSADGLMGCSIKRWWGVA